MVIIIYWHKFENLLLADKKTVCAELCGGYQADHPLCPSSSKATVCYLQVSMPTIPAICFIDLLCRSYSGKGMSMYNKANKATLGELNKQHEIVKLLSTSLNKSHAKGVEVTKKLGLPLKVKLV